MNAYQPKERIVIRLDAGGNIVGYGSANCKFSLRLDKTSGKLKGNVDKIKAYCTANNIIYEEQLEGDEFKEWE